MRIARINYIWVVVLLHGVGILSSCRKELRRETDFQQPVLQNNIECPPQWVIELFVKNNYVLSPLISEPRFVYESPCFNPNNSDEFVYHLRDNLEKKSHLIKYSLISGSQQTLVTMSNRIFGQPKWSRHGWIAFGTAKDYVDHIYVIRDDGSGLKQVTQKIYNFLPFWDYDNALYWTYSPDLSINCMLLKLTSVTADNSTIDTIRGTCNSQRSFDVMGHELIKLFPHPQQTERMIAVKRNLLKQVQDSSTKSELLFVHLFNYGISEISNISFHPFHPVFYVFVVHGLLRENTLYQFSLKGDVKPLLKLCGTHFIEFLSCSPDGKYLLCELVEVKLESCNGMLCMVNYKSIYLIDLVTLQMKLILLSNT